MRTSALAAALESAETITVAEDDGSEWEGVTLPVGTRDELVQLLRSYSFPSAPSSE